MTTDEGRSHHQRVQRHDKVVAGSVKNQLQSMAARVTPEKFKAARHAAQSKPKDVE
jgi:hypothetical protein